MRTTQVKVWGGHWLVVSCVDFSGETLLRSVWDANSTSRGSMFETDRCRRAWGYSQRDTRSIYLRHTKHRAHDPSQGVHRYTRAGLQIQCGVNFFVLNSRRMLAPARKGVAANQGAGTKTRLKSKVLGPKHVSNPICFGPYRNLKKRGERCENLKLAGVCRNLHHESYGIPGLYI